jgi:preprotein translocase subunit SecD
MDILLNETRTRSVFVADENGVMVEQQESYEESRLISHAVIRAALGREFVITGLSQREANDLSLLIRSGALAAPMYFVEERTVGPSLGQENINQGARAVAIGYLLVTLFMLYYYRWFGVAAVIALATNVVLLSAVMSIISATLTLPGIFGIVLTIGMAVDANVLIFSRIREEIAAGLSPQSAIDSGFSRAFGTIFDANITTFLVAMVLFTVGSGPVKGFAIHQAQRNRLFPQGRAVLMRRLGDLRRIVIANRRCQSRDQHQAFLHQLVDAGHIGARADHHIVGEAAGGIAQKLH